MAIIELLSLTKQYIILGVLITSIIMPLGLIVSVMMERLGVRKRKSFRCEQFIIVSLFICYLTLIVGATLLGREARLDIRSMNFYVFYSYKKAWRTFSSLEWRNIFINILLFVPMGILLPLMSKKWQVSWKTYLIGFLFSLSIECIQFRTGIGIAEVDDLMNNTIGVMIGFGIYSLFKKLNPLGEKEKKPTMRKVLTFQLPLIAVIAITMIMIYRYYQL